MLLDDKQPLAFKSANDFSMYIERLAGENRITCLEAVLEYCEQSAIDPEDIAGKISKSLKTKLEQDYRDLNYLPKQAQLDI